MANLPVAFHGGDEAVQGHVIVPPQQGHAAEQGPGLGHAGINLQRPLQAAHGILDEMGETVVGHRLAPVAKQGFRQQLVRVAAHASRTGCGAT